MPGADGRRVQDVIGQGSIRLGVTDAPLDLETIYADVVLAAEGHVETQA